MTIRRQPSDFRVEEKPAPGFLDSLRDRPGRDAQYAVYTLAKTSIATPDAAAFLARELGVRQGQVAYAGLKDKHAETRQLVSVPDGATRRPERVDGRGWSAELLGFSGQPVSAECITGNRFSIVVRDLTRERVRTMERRAGALRRRDRPDSLLVINYFGDQRFGSARHGQGWVARHLIRGEFEQALRLAVGTPSRKDAGRTRRITRACATAWGKWDDLVAQLPRCPERAAFETLASGGSFRDAFAALPYFTQAMSVEAYQSHLWNEAARLLARRIADDTPPAETGNENRIRGPRLLRSDDPFGEMLFPVAAAVSERWRTLVLPLLSRRTRLEDPWADAVSTVLSEQGLTLDDLRIPGLRRPFFGEAPRPLFVDAAEFELSRAEPDELTPGRLHVSVSFDLPRGAYATVVLRALGE
ncbi:MAG TPA: tRNA pseudouridine(13) synthase TruD [Phycisphaerales bacterium]|nr:tRNA pseudouridine(13) synthase TruD [Phycisphaerales bacterium]